MCRHLKVSFLFHSGSFSFSLCSVELCDCDSLSLCWLCTISLMDENSSFTFLLLVAMLLDGYHRCSIAPKADVEFLSDIHFSRIFLSSLFFMIEDYSIIILRNKERGWMESKCFWRKRNVENFAEKKSSPHEVCQKMFCGNFATFH